MSTITGRKKELIVSSNGKKIYPARIESLFKMEPIINQVLLIGDKQPYVTALITVNVAAAEIAERHGASSKGAKPADIVKASAVAEEVERRGEASQQATGALRADPPLSHLRSRVFHRSRRGDAHNESSS